MVVFVGMASVSVRMGSVESHAVSEQVSQATFFFLFFDGSFDNNDNKGTLQYSEK